MKELIIIKIGGHVIDDADKCAQFLEDFARIKQAKILIHGGGKIATELSKKLNIEPKIIDGRRITDKETIDVVTMVYAGLINKKIVATLQSHNCNALGLCGADSNVIQSHKRKNAVIDYGFVGDIDEVNTAFIQLLLDQKITPVFSPITHNQEGLLLNTNADTLASVLAIALSKLYKITLIYGFEKNGLLENLDDENSVIYTIRVPEIQQLKDKQTISGGMLPKVDNIVYALHHGVEKVILCKSENILSLLNGKPIFATTFSI